MRGAAFHPPKWLPIAAFRACSAAVLFTVGLVCAAQDPHPPAPKTDKAPPTVQTVASVSADADNQTASKSNQTAQQKPAAVQTERKKQIADESTQLLSMALALKAEVDKTTKDTLSINVIRKADEIEKLAHNVKEKMKQSAGPS